MQPSPYYSLGSIVSFIPQNTLSNKPLIEVNQWILALSCYSQKYLSLPNSLSTWNICTPLVEVNQAISAWSFKQISLLSKCNVVHTIVLDPFFSFISEYTPSNKPLIPLSKCNLVHTTVFDPFFFYLSLNTLRQTNLLKKLINRY